MKKTIEVVAAIIKNNDEVLATQRGYGEFKGLWEFPGGKIEANEDKKEALIREIKEELDVKISIEEFLCTVKYSYDSFNLIMHCYIVSLLDNDFKLKEHLDARWLKKEDLHKVNWLEADVEVVNKLIENID